MKTIHINLLDSDSIKSAVAELREVRRDWEKKANLVAKEVAGQLGGLINAYCSELPYTDEFINLKTHTIEPKKDFIRAWDLRPSKNGWTITVKGKDVVFVEFGAGAYHNSNGSENPLSEAVSFNTDIGSYGKGQGLNQYWFVAHNLISRGTPMYMPIYRAILAIQPEIPTIVRQVFV